MAPAVARRFLREHPAYLSHSAPMLRTRLDVVSDLMSRHPPWADQVRSMAPETRVQLMVIKTTRYARLRWVAGMGYCKLDILAIP